MIGSDPPTLVSNEAARLFSPRPWGAETQPAVLASSTAYLSGRRRGNPIAFANGR
jgi:hypothetical protein